MCVYMMLFVFFTNVSLNICQMEENYLIYTFQLNYDPQTLGPSPVVRTSKAAVIVECHYPRCVDYQREVVNKNNLK